MNKSALCRECALCCNGVLFADVKLKHGESVAKYRELGLTFSGPSSRNLPRMPQPCAALQGCVCSIYSERPAYCRAFECAVLKRLETGRLDERRALELIRSAQATSAEVEKLMQRLGDKDKQLSLALRFKRLMRQAMKGAVPRELAPAYAELTTAMHRLNVLLSTEFYPGNCHET